MLGKGVILEFFHSFNQAIFMKPQLELDAVMGIL